jgi:hypothetical protein
MNIPTFIPGGYGLGAGVTASQCVAMGSDGRITETIPLPQTVLPVDIAVSPDGSYAAVVAAGAGFSAGLSELTFIDFQASSPPPAGIPTLSPLDGGAPVPFVAEQPVSVAFDGSGHVLVQMREPAELHILPAPAASSSRLFNPIGGTVVTLSKISRADTGHDIFHASAGATVACASCHPEGGDDGHVWLINGSPRRTPSLRGTIAGTAPYHWPGDEMDLPTLALDVYTGRMGGAMLAADQTAALLAWVQSIPAPPAPSWVDPASAQRGKLVFEGTTAACSTCHSGPKFTNNQTVNVGTCGALQVPPLVGVGWRAPLMHNGCASTLGERFTKCATTEHGNLAALSPQDVSDLTAYLETL